MLQTSTCTNSDNDSWTVRVVDQHQSDICRRGNDCTSAINDATSTAPFRKLPAAAGCTLFSDLKVKISLEFQRYMIRRWLTESSNERCIISQPNETRCWATISSLCSCGILSRGWCRRTATSVIAIRVIDGFHRQSNNAAEHWTVLAMVSLS